MLLLAKNLGENIVRLRQLKGWTQADLAHYADLTVASISKIERGVTNPTLKTLDKIADALGVETDSLLRFWFSSGSRITPGAFFIVRENIEFSHALWYSDYKYNYVQRQTEPIFVGSICCTLAGSVYACLPVVKSISYLITDFNIQNAEIW